jgi:threonine dehydrogenase-like Zn-dependent dehydrogenase
MKETMKAVVSAGPKKSVLKDVPKPVPTDDQVLIQMKYQGVCMSENYGWSTAKAGDAFGHEPMGIIAAVGKNVKDFKVGDRISGFWGSSLPGTGGMIQFVAVEPKHALLIKLPDHIRDEDLLLEPLACLLSAVSKHKVSMPGTKVAVVGCGYMGCGIISLLKLRGAYVVGIDIRKESLADAKKYGADEVYLVDEAKKKFIDTDFPGFPVVSEWAETSESLDLAAKLTKQCGQLCVGAYHTGENRCVDMRFLNERAIECLSVHPREWDLCVAGAENAEKLLSSGEWKFLNIPTKIYPMNKFDRAQAELETKYGKYMKALVDMTKEDGEPYII